MNNQTRLTEFDDSILPWFGRTMKLLDLYIASYLNQHKINLTKVQLILLTRLYFNDGQPQNDLALITNRDKASLARLIDTLERKGLVVRAISKEDKRIKLVHITKKGTELYEASRPVVKKMIKTVQKGMDGDEIKFTIEILKRVQQNIELNTLVA